MFRFTILAVVVVLLCSDAEGKRKRKGPKGGSRELDTVIDDLQKQVTALELRFDSLPASATIDTSAAHDTCPSEKVHLHFHGGEEDVDHGSPDDTYIHVKLDVEDHHDYHGHGGHRRFHDPEDEFSGHCEMQSADGSGIHGFLHLTQKMKDKTATVMIDMAEFPEPNAEHGIHFHQWGDLSEGCASLGNHFDPTDEDVDVGDLGTVTTDDDSTVTHTFDNVRLSLFGPPPFSLIGRSAIIHDKDGAPLACCVIGWGKENAVHATHGHHSHHHDSIDHDHHGHGSHHGPMKKQE